MLYDFTIELRQIEWLMQDWLICQKVPIENIISTISSQLHTHLSTNIKTYTINIYTVVITQVGVKNVYANEMRLFLNTLLKLTYNCIGCCLLSFAMYPSIHLPMAQVCNDNITNKMALQDSSLLYIGIHQHHLALNWSAFERKWTNNADCVSIPENPKYTKNQPAIM